MLAAVITRSGGPEVIEIREVPRPTPGPGEILVRVHASALNRADLLQREGRYPAPSGWPADIPGLEFAGSVEACGNRAWMWQPGQRVIGLVGGGAHAEFLAIHERAVAEIPQPLDWSEAAAIPEAFITAHDALFVQAGLRPAERLFVPAVGSGVGLAAVQLARAAGAECWGTSRTQWKVERAMELGLSGGAAIRDPVVELPSWVEQWTNRKGFDVALDLAGGPYVRAAIEALCHKGRLILVGTVAGGRAEIPIGTVMGKRLTLRGTVMRARPLEERIGAVRSFSAEALPFFARRQLRAVVDSEFALADIAAAHQRLASNATFGKVVLRIPAG
ncbi:MAG: NAD(P)H-quinone oxidoreductase [Acidobacteria bacterium]|nr:NAD(P)H-quinone oxidoreductase [Acidobacteriota bacterium]